MNIELNKKPQLNKNAVMRSFYKRNEFLCNLFFSSCLMLYVNFGNPIMVHRKVYKEIFYVVSL